MAMVTVDGGIELAMMYSRHDVHLPLSAQREHLDRIVIFLDMRPKVGGVGTIAEALRMGAKAVETPDPAQSAMVSTQWDAHGCSRPTTFEPRTGEGRGDEDGERRTHNTPLCIARRSPPLRWSDGSDEFAVSSSLT